ncbi:MAG: hypothetical protein PHP07_07635 [Eubacteriales bacterium]|jgi:uncharacterized membrane protein (UPF0136 family)|nr:hypothetical protein [Eubacteriales bacterium]
MKQFQTKRMKVSILAGAVLGVVCIAGALVRSGGTAGFGFLFALWFNRVLMGMTIGLAHEKADQRTLILRGALLGLIVSFAFYSASGFTDVVSFLAGVVYGVIIEFAARKVDGQV